MLPFTHAPSAKNLGLAVFNLSLKILPQLSMQAVALCLDGQEVIRDIRLLDYRYVSDNEEQQPFDYSRDQGPVAFNIHDRTICVFLDGDCQRRTLALRFSLGQDVIEEAKEDSHEFILQQCHVFQLIVTPFVQAAMSSLSMTSLISTK